MGQKISHATQHIIEAFELPSRPPPLFVSMGMIVFDNIYYPRRLTRYRVPGGSGLWATFGARLFKSGVQSSQVGCLCVAGRDFSYLLFVTLCTWHISLYTRIKWSEASTSARLEYQSTNTHRKKFEYEIHGVYPSLSDLQQTPLLASRSFHFLALPSEIKEWTAALLSCRAHRGIQERPLIVWEPPAIACNPDNLRRHFEMLPLVDVFSPNHDELVGLTASPDVNIDFSRDWVEAQAEAFVNSGIGPSGNGMVVIRCGRHGVFYMRSDEEKGWISAYYDHRRFEVFEPTGSGSAFLGAFTICLVETNDPREACLRGTVAASFALEQYGLPRKMFRRRPRKNRFQLGRVEEIWNDEDPIYRLQEIHPDY